MYSRQSIQKKTPRNSAAEPEQSSLLRSRPFNNEAERAGILPQQQEMPDIATQLDRAKRFGHSFSQIKVQADTAEAIQPKLTVGAPGDKYEQEADSVASQVMSLAAPGNQQPIQREMAQEEEQESVQAKPLAASITPLIQREMAPEQQEEEPVQAKSLSGTLQRETAPEQQEEEPVQAKSLSGTLQRETAPEQQEEEPVQTKRSQNDSFQTSSNLENQLTASKGSGNPLPNEVRAFMEPRFGADFSQVRVHTDSQAVQMNKEIGAQAFTHGRDIYFGAGKSPDKSELTAHELTHVVQQTGAVQLKHQSEDKAVQVAVQPKCANCQAEDEPLRRKEGNEAETTNEVQQTLQRSLNVGQARIQRQTVSGDPQCRPLLDQIRRFIFSRKPPNDMKGLIQRWEELRADPQNLQWDYWTNPHPQYGSVESHQQQFRNMQQGLRKRLNEWNSKNCNDPNGLPQDAWNWASRPAPVPIPRPRPAPFSSHSVSVSDVIKALTILGLSIAMVGVVIAALADPEPASKLALAGLSVVMITSLLNLLGIEDKSKRTTA
jgi:hypothetical protein